MTIADIIFKSVKVLPVAKQRQALSYVRGLGAPNGRSRRAGRKVSRKGTNGEEVYVPKDLALRAIVGMWADRTDLPKDGVISSMILRRRTMRRGGRG